MPITLTIVGLLVVLVVSYCRVIAVHPDGGGAVVFIASKFTTGAWVVIITIPALMLLFHRIQTYYRSIGVELALGELPDPPSAAKA